MSDQVTTPDHRENEINKSVDLSPTTTQYFIGIGASAGGLEAIHELFDTIPDNTGFSFIIVQHLSPDYKSLMPELLAKHTQMEVCDAIDNMVVRTNCIYFIPNNKLMTIKNGILKLTEKVISREPNRAIDIFFHSLAEDQKRNAIGIILSGTGTDGTEGITSIKKAGGFTIAQDPSCAKFDGMPNSAISSGNIDVVATPELIFEEINTYVKEPNLARSITESFTEKEENLLREVFGLIRNYTSIDFTYYKRPTIIRRIARRMLYNKIENLEDYLDYLYTNPKESAILGKEFLIGVTKFFRDTEAFELLTNRVIPEIISNKELKGEPLKIWITGCSTGEEAYSIAILVKEYLEKRKLNLNLKIFATDIDKEAIDIASKGCYPLSIEKDIKAERLERFFTKDKNHYQIIPEIRKMVIFAPHDLIKDPPFSRIDLVTCRNLLIYLSPPLQQKVLSSLHFALNLNGYLFIGPSENLGELSNVFVEVDRKWKLYKNAEMGKMHSKDSYVTPDLNIRTYPGHMGYNYKTTNSKDAYSDLLFEAAFEEFGYAGVYVDENFEIIEARGDIRKFMILPDKKFDLNILKMLPDNISIALGAALHKAAKKKERVVVRSAKIKEQDKIRYIDIIIRPYLDHGKLSRKSLLIMFCDSKIQKTYEETLAQMPEEFKANERIKELEGELVEIKENLQSAIEEVETSNEELQSSNEELISANEELQSTNEELQSLNEELHTVNSEHQQKIKELIELNDDLNNYFSSTNIGQIFIDKDLLIRKFTPSVTHQINLIDGDIGRPIYHISNNFRYENLIEDIRHVMKNTVVVDRELEVTSGKYYQMRIQPYIRLDKTIDGVIITFIDITEIKNLNNLISGILNNSVSGIMAFKSIRNQKNKITNFRWELINKKAEEIVEGKAADLIGKNLIGEVSTTIQLELYDKYVEVVESGKNLNMEYYSSYNDKWFNVVAVKLGDGFTVTFTDITEKKIAEEKVSAAYYELKKAQESLKIFNEELEMKVDERTKELVKINRDFELALEENKKDKEKVSKINSELIEKNLELVKINNDLDNFIYTASHDLKAPVSNIEGLIHALTDSISESSRKDEIVKSILSMILASIDRFKTTIQDLTEITKIQKNVDEEIATINIPEMIEDVKLSIRDMIINSDAKIKVECNCPTIVFSKKNFKSILYNLISNAIKYRAYDRTPEISIVAKELDDYNLLMVEDNGLGIDEKKKGQMFTMFKRFHDHVEGTGVGLYIVKRIIDNAGGKIEVDSKLNKGTAFRLYFKKNQVKTPEL